MNKKVVVSKIRFNNYNDISWDEITDRNKFSYGYLVIDEITETIGFYPDDGVKPLAEDVFSAILTNRRAQALLRNYLKKGRKWPFKILRYEGQSDCLDYYIQTFRYVPALKNSWDICVPKKKTWLCHITMYQKIHSEGFRMYSGDLFEMLCKHFRKSSAEDLLNIKMRKNWKYMKYDQDYDEGVMFRSPMEEKNDKEEEDEE